MNDDKFYVEFNEPDDTIVINNSIKTKGAISYTISKETTKNEYDIDVESIVIKGILITPYYIQNIKKIETARFIVDNIDIVQEDFGSKDSNIVYKFKAEYARVKYQTADYQILKENSNIK